MSIIKKINYIFEEHIVIPFIYMFPSLFRKVYSQKWGVDIKKEAEQLRKMSDKEMRRRIACMTDEQFAGYQKKLEEMKSEKLV